MSTVGAIALDSYRELNSKRLFWVTLAISALVVLAFAAIGINEKGITILWWEFESVVNSNLVKPEVFYKGLFTGLGVGFWLAWLATILALVSTAGIFPEFVSSGTVPLVLSKPIPRWRLFLLKYLGSLAFVALQVTLFAVASFFVLGIRGGVWEPMVLLAIPIVVLFYSYLYSICVLIGLITRSTIAALLLTLLVWVGLFSVHAVESGLLTVRAVSDLTVENINAEIERIEGRVEAGRVERDAADARIAVLVAEREQVTEKTQNWRYIHTGTMVLKTVLPKTSETIALLERWMVEMADMPEGQQSGEEPSEMARMFGSASKFAPSDEAVQFEIIERTRGRSVTWVIGTSLLFEIVVLGVAMWIFIRRDF